ncbi:MAG: MFS transporter, partial [Planctomycetota bacterium]
PEEAGGDVFGFGAIRLLKEPAFLLFVLCAFLITIPSTFYFVGCHPMLVQTGRPVPTALMTLSQVSEIFVMFTMPLFIARIGLSRVLAIGMAAWAIRYVCFGTLSFPLILLALLLHGFCYSFVFVGAYIYVDKKAPRDLRASAQSLIAFLMLGVGWFIGAQICGRTMDRYPPLVKNMPATQKTAVAIEKIPDASLPAWGDPHAGTSPWRYLDLSGTIKGWLPGGAAEAPPEIVDKVDATGDGRITLADLDQIAKEGLEFRDETYTKQAVLEALASSELAETLDADADGRITLAELMLTRDEEVESRGKTYARDLLIQVFAKPDIAEMLDANGDGQITKAELAQIPDDGLKSGDKVYAENDLIGVFEKIDGNKEVRTKADFVAALKDAERNEIRVTRSDWLDAQSYQWSRIWFWPAGMAAIVCVLFWLGSRVTGVADEDEPEEESASNEPQEGDQPDSG